MKKVINGVLGKVFWSLQGRPIVLFTLFCAFFRCKLKFNLVSNIISFSSQVGELYFETCYGVGFCVVLAMRRVFEAAISTFYMIFVPKILSQYMRRIPFPVKFEVYSSIANLLQMDSTISNFPLQQPFSRTLRQNTTHVLWDDLADQFQGCPKSSQHPRKHLR